jgi:hypothetical protein
MSAAEGTERRRGRAAVRALVIALVAVVCGAFATTAGAHRVMIVTQEEAPAKVPAKVFYFKTIQAAVNATEKGDYVLIAPGVYTEEVKVEKPHTNIWIRGMDRNGVVIDGQGKVGNGIEVFKDSNVWIENLTVRNFEFGEGCLVESCGNDIWWNGGADSGKIGAKGWWGRYLTAYDTGLNGGYGIFTNNETKGQWEKIYASGFADSGMYLGACRECQAVIKEATMENNSLGYSGSNSGGNLVIENSLFKHNTNGIAPNSENPGDKWPPQNGACNPIPSWKTNHRVLPTFSTTAIERCTIIRDNVIEENDNINAPGNSSTEAAPWGTGIQLPGDYADLIENNVIRNNPTNGVLGFEYPNPFPIAEDTIYFQLAGNKIANNTFEGNGFALPKHATATEDEEEGNFSGDVTIAGGLFGEQRSTNNCVSGNTFTSYTFPQEIEGTWGCQNATTPNPNLGFAGIGYLLALQEVSEKRTPEVQPLPGPQETMPNPCAGVPVKNALCP